MVVKKNKLLCCFTLLLVLLGSSSTAFAINSSEQYSTDPTHDKHALYITRNIISYGSAKDDISQIGDIEQVNIEGDYPTIEELKKYAVEVDGYNYLGFELLPPTENISYHCVEYYYSRLGDPEIDVEAEREYYSENIEYPATPHTVSIADYDSNPLNEIEYENTEFMNNEVSVVQDTNLQTDNDLSLNSLNSEDITTNINEVDRTQTDTSNKDKHITFPAAYLTIFILICGLAAFVFIRKRKKQ